MLGLEHVVRYELFALRIARSLRYLRDDISERFLQSVLTTVPKRLSIIKKGELVWRAQLGMNGARQEFDKHSIPLTKETPFPPERMKPVAGTATEGRANPKGKPFLYVATNPDTAMSEVRPHLSSPISLAKLQICRALRIVDCTMRQRLAIDESKNDKEASRREHYERMLWSDIDHAFSLPINQSDSAADYTPTQVISECIGADGYDGIKYRSGYRAYGHNIVLFNPLDAEIINVKLMRAYCINMTFFEW